MRIMVKEVIHMTTVDFVRVNTKVTNKSLLLSIVDSLIAGLSMIAVFLMVTGFLYLIR